MKKCIFLGVFILFFGTLTSCTTSPKLPANHGVTFETWANQINVNPTRWIKHADHWFLTGELDHHDKRLSHRITPRPAGKFREIDIAGDFKVQIVGDEREDCVYIYGSKKEAKTIVVEKFEDKIFIHPSTVEPLSKIIVRIHVRDLTHLSYMGNGTLWGRNILSKDLHIENRASGSIFLVSKSLPLKEVVNTGSGTVTIIGVESPHVNLNVQGNGDVNLSGRVGVELINHNGAGCINIIGADSNGLCIYAYGSGLTTVAGIVKLKEVTACNSARVFVNCVNGGEMHIQERNDAVVGVSGSTHILNVDLGDRACFEGGRLHAVEAYIHTQNNAYANIATERKIFADAKEQSRIYYFGPTNISVFAENDTRVLRLGAFMPFALCQGFR